MTISAAPAIQTPNLRHSIPVNVLFSMRNFWYIKMYESVLRQLAKRGHTVHVVADQGVEGERAAEWNEAAESLAAECPSITYGLAPRVPDPWIDLAVYLRLALDYLWFLAPTHDEAPILRIRAADRTPPSVVTLTTRPLMRTRAGRRLLGAALGVMEQAVPANAELAAFIEEASPDVVVLTPLITKGSSQFDLLKAAQSIGVPTMLAVGSWDHLTSKAPIRIVPDQVLVWNDTQKTEATDLHHVDADRIVVTGAQCFDRWFDRRPSASREEFCRAVGLRPERPFVFYACSALFEGSPSEAAFAVDWIRRVRSTKPGALRDIGILIRPHPKRGFEWDDINLPSVENVAIWPRAATRPVDPVTQDGYFDSMYHAAAVVGLNTSALIEAGIVGRSVLTILRPEFQESQEGTLHFRYLLDGGLLHVARTIEEYLDQLAACVGQAGPDDRARRFVEAFVRPHGVEEPATPNVVTALERTAERGQRPAMGTPLWHYPLRLALYPFARTVAGTILDRKAVLRASRRQAKQSAKEAELATKRLARDRRREARALERQQQVEHRRVEKAEARARGRHAKLEEKARRQTRKADELKRWRASKKRARLRRRVSDYVGRWIHRDLKTL